MEPSPPEPDPDSLVATRIPRSGPALKFRTPCHRYRPYKRTAPRYQFARSRMPQEKEEPGALQDGSPPTRRGNIVEELVLTQHEGENEEARNRRIIDVAIETQQCLDRQYGEGKYEVEAVLSGDEYNPSKTA